MSKKISTDSSKSKKQPAVPGFTFIKQIDQIEEYVLKSNGLKILFLNRKDTGVVTTNITYFVGARDESRGETGIAHMLEHMLFKPTAYDNKHHITEGSAMHFERKTGSTINANTWKDRTTYYFSYPKEYFNEALRIEADRMENVNLTEKVLKPEQGNVLSEFDMYNGDPSFALSVQLCSTAYHSHPYGHETIGYREDIEDYTAEKLARFYKNYYRPDNAVLMVVGDIDISTALLGIKRHFGAIKHPNTPIPRLATREPKQEGARRVIIERPATTNLLSFGFKHPGFPSKDWFTTVIMANILTTGPESILHKLLVDTGKAAHLSSVIEPTSEENLGIIEVSLAPKQDHAEIEKRILDSINSLDTQQIDHLVKKAKAGLITDELFGRTESLHIVQELTEYASADTVESYAMTPKILASITTKEVLQCIKQSFKHNNMTIGYFIGKEQNI